VNGSHKHNKYLINSVGRKAITTTCFGPQLAIVRLYTLKRIFNTICKYLDVEISYILTLCTDGDSIELDSIELDVVVGGCWV